MTSSLVFVATTAALVLSGGLLAASSGLRSVPAYLLATYVVAYAELVLLIAALSFAELVVRWALVAGVTAMLAVGVVIWVCTGRPRGPSIAPALRKLRSVLSDPPLAILAAVVAVGFAYAAALALFTPPNGLDALWYHLSRAAIWKQEHAVGYIPDANDARLNANPPVGEIAVVYTMVVTGTDRFVTTVALAAYLTLPVAVFGIARRLFVGRRPAFCAALVFATVPVALLQASGAKNDLVLASFATACVFFCLGARRVEIILAAVAVALALGTKIFAPLFLPIIALIVAAGTSKRRAFALAAVAGLPIVIGSAWIFVNRAHTTSSLGDLATEAPTSRLSGGVDVIPTTIRYLINFAEVPGATGWWITCYVAAAIALAALLLRNRDRWSRRSIAAGALLGLIPFFVIALGPLAKRGYQYVLFHLGRPDLGILDEGRDVYGADPNSAYFGPVGLAVLFSLFVLINRRRVIPRVAFFLAAAPLLLVLGVAFFVGYSGTSGRFFLFPMALAMAAFAVFLSSRPVVWALVALSIPTVALALRANIEKPPSIWGKSRWQIQTHVGPNNEQVHLIRFAAESLPRNGQLGLALNEHDISYPFFDPHLERRIRFVSSTDMLPPGLDWLVLSPQKTAPPGGWRQVLRTPGGWRLYER